MGTPLFCVGLQEVDSLVDIAIDASHQKGIVGLEDVLLDMKRQAKQENKERALGLPRKPKETKTMDLQQFIHVFTGPPCTLAGCGALTQQLKRTSEKQALEVRLCARVHADATTSMPRRRCHLCAVNEADDFPIYRAVVGGLGWQLRNPCRSAWRTSALSFRAN